MNEYIYVVHYCPEGTPDNDLMWCAKTFEGAFEAVNSFIQENEEEWEDTEHNWDNEWRYFTDGGIYTITREPLNP